MKSLLHQAMNLHLQAEFADHEESASPSHESSSSSFQRSRIREMGSVVASITGYVGDERSKLIKLINSSGAYYVGKLLKGSVTHLVCWTFDGPKYEMAKRFGVRIINHQWFEDCFKAGRCLDEIPYTRRSGKDVGPLIWMEAKHGSSSSKQAKLKLASSSWNVHDNHNLSKIKAGRRYCEAGAYNVRDPVLSSKRAWSDEILDISDEDNELKALLQSSRTKRNKRQQKGSLGLKKCRVFKTDDIQDDPACSSSIKSFEAFFSKSPRENGVACTHLPPEKENRKNEASLSLKSCGRAVSTEETLPDDRASCISRGCTEGNSFEKLRESPVACTLVPADIECAICHAEQIASAEGVLACGHSFCYQCIMKWASEVVSKPPTCPLCKASFDMVTKREQKLPSSDGEVAYEESVVMLQCGDNLTSEQLEESIPVLSCILCGIGDMEEVLLTCSGCRARSAHRFCLDPPVPLSSTNQWYCGRCSQRRRADTAWWHHLHVFDSSG